MMLTAISGCGILAANWLSSPPFNVIPIFVAAVAIFLDIKSHVIDYGAKAEKALADGDGVATDEKIDCYLPENLRRS